MAVSGSVSAVLSGVPVSGTPSLALSGPSGAVAGSSSWDAATRTVRFAPASALAYAATYSAVASLGGTTLSGGTWSFTTGAVPLPVVSSTSPASGASGVAVSGSVSAVLSGVPVSGTPSLALSGPSGAVAGSSSWDAATRTVRFAPSSALAYAATYSAVASLGGTTLSGGTWSFTTGAVPLPVVSSTSPASGASGVAVSGSVSAVLSGVPVSGTPSLALSGPSGAVAGSSSWDAATRTVRFAPSSALAYAATYSAVASLGGTALSGGTWSFTTGAAPLPAIQRYIVHVYRDLFHRAVDPSGLATWTAALESGTPRVAVANSITSSTEYRSALIQGTYQKYLGRSADPTGLAYWLRQMSVGRTISDIEVGFLASPEYYAQAGSTDAGWVRRLYQHVLGRSAADAEVAYWVARVPAIGRGGVARGFVVSSEYLASVVDGYYVSILGRHIDPSGRATWVAAIQRGARLEEIIGAIVASPEYYARG